jgi:SAM-dependent methyltransferase
MSGLAGTSPVPATEEPPFACPVCDGPLSGPVVARESTPRGDVAVRRCPSCGLHVTWPRLADSQDTYAVFDEDAFDAKYGAVERGERPHDRDVNYREQVRIVERYVPGGRVLDVGCHAGWLLGYLQRSGAGYELQGVEPSDSLAELARRRLGIPVRSGFLQDVQGEQYDAIVATDVIEHVAPDDMNDFFEALGRCLRPGGHVFLKTPNARFTALKSAIAGRLPARLRRFVILADDMWDAKEHLTLWDTATLTRMLRKHGLVPVTTIVPLPVQTGSSPPGAYLLRSALYRAARAANRAGRFPAIAQDIFVVARRPA